MAISDLDNLIGRETLNGWKAITLPFKFLIFAMTSSSGGKLNLKTAQKCQKNKSGFKGLSFSKKLLGDFHSYICYCFRNQDVCVVKISGNLDNFLTRQGGSKNL